MWPSTALSPLEECWMMARLKAELWDTLTRDLDAVLLTRVPTASELPIPSLPCFLQHVVARVKPEPSALLIAAIFLRRLIHRLTSRQTTIRGHATTPQRLFLVALILANKSIHDVAPRNRHWAEYLDGLFSVSEIGQMERQFLMLMDYQLVVTPSQFDCMVTQLHRTVPVQKTWQVGREKTPVRVRADAYSPSSEPAVLPPTEPMAWMPSVVPSPLYAPSSTSSSSTLASSPDSLPSPPPVVHVMPKKSQYDAFHPSSPMDWMA
ncbi:hypothetical protein BC940DRAFT_61613 [Gongronella butleri]|nr:hypothetical protein BC940DRAFT_61613 [Gongronella butleri]